MSSKTGTMIRYIQMTSFTIFAMFFGASNLIFPVKLGILGGSHWFWAFVGFCVTGVVLPALGLLAIVAFGGNYSAFFNRIGKIPGSLMVFVSMLFLGPIVVIPRIVTFTYEMLHPFLPMFSLLTFSIAFLALTFLASFHKERLLSLIGKLLSPLKIGSVLLIIIIGLWTALPTMKSTVSRTELFTQGVVWGFGTLDLLAAIFFGAMIITLLHAYAAAHQDHLTDKKLLTIAGIGGIGGGLLLATVYAGLCALSASHGHGLAQFNEGQIFSAISFRVLGAYGAALIGFTIFLACFTTTITLSAVVADYSQKILFKSKISYVSTLIGSLIITGVFAQLGLSSIIKYSMPVISFLYPLFIIVTLCNIAYALWNFKPIKAPVALMAVIMGIVSLAKWFWL